MRQSILIRRNRPEVYMFKFSAYPPASFWDKTKMMLKISAIPSPQEQDKKLPADKEKQDQEQGQQINLSLAAKIA